LVTNLKLHASIHARHDLMHAYISLRYVREVLFYFKQICFKF
jgi:hypothetical protein